MLAQVSIRSAVNPVTLLRDTWVVIQTDDTSVTLEIGQFDATRLAFPYRRRQHQHTRLSGSQTSLC